MKMYITVRGLEGSNLALNYKISLVSATFHAGAMSEPEHAQSEDDSQSRFSRIRLELGFNYIDISLSI